VFQSVTLAAFYDSVKREHTTRYPGERRDQGLQSQGALAAGASSNAESKARRHFQQIGPTASKLSMLLGRCILTQCVLLPLGVV